MYYSAIIYLKPKCFNHKSCIKLCQFVCATLWLQQLPLLALLLLLLLLLPIAAVGKDFACLINHFQI